MLDKINDLLILLIGIMTLIIMIYAYYDIWRFKHAENVMTIKIDQTISTPDGTCNVIQKEE